MQSRKGNSFDESLTKAWPTWIFQNPVSSSLFGKSSQIFQVSTVPFFLLHFPLQGEPGLEPHSLDFCQQDSWFESAKERFWYVFCRQRKAEVLVLSSSSQGVDVMRCGWMLPVASFQSSGELYPSALLPGFQPLKISYQHDSNPSHKFLNF